MKTQRLSSQRDFASERSRASSQKLQTILLISVPVLLLIIIVFWLIWLNFTQPERMHDHEKWQTSEPGKKQSAGLKETPTITTLPGSAEHLSKVAAEVNRSVPVMIDKETEFMRAVGAHDMLIYNYRLVRYSAAQLNHEKFAAAAKQQNTQGACSEPDTRDGFLKKGVTLRYSYFDKDKKHIATVNVTPSDCGF